MHRVRARLHVGGPLAAASGLVLHQVCLFVSVSFSSAARNICTQAFTNVRSRAWPNQTAPPGTGHDVQIQFVARSLRTQWPDIECLDQTDIALHAERFRGGINNWVVQTYLHLRESLRDAGMRPTIGERFVSACINVAHRDSLNRLTAPYHRSYIVGVRADRPPLHACQWEVVQNTLEPPKARTRYLPLWPQPGLVPRDESRGARIERIAYFGRTSAAPAWFYERSFHDALRRIGVVFEIRDSRWFDYSNVDLVLAHRIEAATMLRHKPASKLVNAWFAGVPALLGNEPAFAQLRHSAVDYISIETPQDVIAAIEELRAVPARYHAMVANGRRRCIAFSADATTARWLHFLLNDVVSDAVEWRDAGRDARWGWFAQIGAMARQKIATKRFKLRVYRECHQQSYLRVLR